MFIEFGPLISHMTARKDGHFKMPEYKPMFKRGEVKTVKIDLTPYLIKIVTKNYALLKELGK